MTKDEFIAALQTDEQKQRFQALCEDVENRLKKQVNSTINNIKDPIKFIDDLLASDKPIADFIAALQTDEQKQRFQAYCDILQYRVHKSVKSSIENIKDPIKFIDALLADDKKKTDALKAKQDLENLIVECKGYGIDPIKVLKDSIKEQKKAAIIAAKAELDAQLAALG